MSEPPKAGVPDLSLYLSRVLGTSPTQTAGDDDARPWVELGEFLPADNAALLMRVINQAAADYPALETYERFERRFQNPPQKPRAPNSQNPDLYRNPPSFQNAHEAVVWRLWRLKKAQTRYIHALTTYEQESAKHKEITRHHGCHVGGYLDFVRATVPAAASFFFTPRRLPISETERRRHSYISGASGSGKTEAIKHLVHHYLSRNTSTAVVVLDPHGDLAHQIAQFRENADDDRVVYIDPLLSREHTPVFNPFVVKDTSPEAIDVATQELVGVFLQIMKGSGLSLQMDALLKPCLSALLLKGDATIRDLKTFMDDEANGELLRLADHLPNPEQRAFLQQDFLRDTYNPTKQSIRTRLQSLLNSQIFLHFMVGQSTFDLDALLRQRKVVVFNLSRGVIGYETSEALGRFIVAWLQSWAQQQAKIPEARRVPVHLFVDECQLYVSESIERILTEARKYRLYVTLSQQMLGQNMSQQLREAVLSNTAVKMTGRNATKSLAALAKETGAELDDLQALNVGQFHVKVGNRPSIKVTLPDHLLGTKNAMPKDAWTAFLARQLGRYYAPVPATIPDQAKEPRPTDQLPASASAPTRQPPRRTPKYPVSS